MKRSVLIAAVAMAAALSACGASSPAVGKCTNANPKLGVELNVLIVDCGDSSATTRITKSATNRTDCASGSLRYGEQTFCTEPL